MSCRGPVTHAPPQQEFLRALPRLLKAVGIHRTRRSLAVGPWQIDPRPYESGPTWQDHNATREDIENAYRRIRIYLYERESDPEKRESVRHAAQREFLAGQGIDHPGLLVPRELLEHDMGPALVIDQRADAMRLDHYLVQYGDELDLPARLGLIRQLAEAVSYAHDRRLVHRALSPRAIIVEPGEGGWLRPRLRIGEWQAAARGLSAARTMHRVAPTTHAYEHVEAAAVPTWLRSSRPRPRCSGRLSRRRVVSPSSPSQSRFRNRPCASGVAVTIRLPTQWPCRAGGSLGSPQHDRQVPAVGLAGWATGVHRCALGPAQHGARADDRAPADECAGRGDRSGRSARLEPTAPGATADPEQAIESEPVIREAAGKRWVVIIGGVWLLVPRSTAIAEGRTIVVQNKVAFGPSSLVEDRSPSYLASRPVARCANLPGCKLDGTDVGTGDTLQAVCQLQGELLTNADVKSPGVKTNPNVAGSALWYGIVWRDRRRGYISEVYVGPTYRGGLGLPAC